MINDFLVLIRPTHWIKNSLILAALLFSFSFNRLAWSEALLALVGFSLLASAVYVINDLIDAPADRQHPDKKDRPIAAGKVSSGQAIGLAAVLFLAALSLLWTLGAPSLIVSLIYFLLNIAYSLALKHVPIVDVMIVAFGFVLRVILGAVAIKVTVSHWILLCTFFLALFFAFGKRKNEMTLLKDTDRGHRRSMREYTDGFINQMLALTSGVAVVFYSLYTIDPNTISRFQNDDLIYTTPIVVFGVLRYFFLLYNRDLGGDPVRLFLRDKQLFASGVVWLAAVLIVYAYH